MGHMKDLDRRIRQGGDDAIAAACELAGIAKERLRLLSQNGDCPDPDNAENRDNTPATHAAPSEGSERGGCTLTDWEREAVEQAIDAANGMILAEPWAIQTLRAILERTK